MTTILLATGNAHKSSEMRQILTPIMPSSIRLLDTRDLNLPAPPPDIEMYETFEDNAKAKALWYAKTANLPCIADDSGLCVNALNGAPGVRSARWAGPTATDLDRCRLLLDEILKVDALERSQRIAEFVCACVYAIPGSSDIIACTGKVAGEILSKPRGFNGFGYDPLFYIPDINQSMADISQEAKNSISHRALGLHALASKIWGDMQ